MIYITGDTHGDFQRIEKFCCDNKTKPSDVMIILGDAGINYFGDERDYIKKRFLKNLPITLFCIHGNHEMRPQKISSYKEQLFNGGIVWAEDDFPNILFANDGELFDFNGKKCLVIGGAYSVDKYYRLSRGFKWFEDEQPDEEIKNRVKNRLAEIDFKTDIILSHTCPRKYEPIEAFLPGLDQSMIDKSTENWLDEIEEKTIYSKWYCGHWHITKRIDKVIFMFEDINIIDFD